MMRPALLFIFFPLIFFPFLRLHAAEDALDRLNAERATRGQHAFIRDEGLSIGAARCADVRARIHRWNHTSNDFGYLPAGVSADCAGCGLLVSYFNACYANSPSREFPAHYRFAGAAIAYDEAGRGYCHLFVSNRPSNIQPARPLANLTQRVVYAAAQATNRVLRPAPVPADESADVRHSGRRRFLSRRK